MLSPEQREHLGRRLQEERQRLPRKSNWRSVRGCRRSWPKSTPRLTDWRHRQRRSVRMTRPVSRSRSSDWPSFRTRASGPNGRQRLKPSRSRAEPNVCTAGAIARRGSQLGPCWDVTVFLHRWQATSRSHIVQRKYDGVGGRNVIDDVVISSSPRNCTLALGTIGSAFRTIVVLIARPACRSRLDSTAHGSARRRCRATGRNRNEAARRQSTGDGSRRCFQG